MDLVKASLIKYPWMDMRVLFEEPLERATLAGTPVSVAADASALKSLVTTYGVGWRVPDATGNLNMDGEWVATRP